MKRLLIIALLITGCSESSDISNPIPEEEYVTVQQRLDDGYSPLDVFNDVGNIDSIYGKFYAGGVIFHFNKSNGGGMVVMKNGQLTSDWGPNTTITTSTELGSGESNTNAIIDFYSEYPDLQERTAAYKCAALTLNGYSDWFMPSKDEMKKVADILFNEDHLDNIGIGANRYWTSSSVDHYNSWSIITSTAEAKVFEKNGVYSEVGVKPVRKF